MANRKFLWCVILVFSVLCASLCLVGWLKLNAQWKSAHTETQATQTWIDTLTRQHGEELSRLIETYERERRGTSEIQDLAITVTHRYVLEYTETRCQAYAAVAIESGHISNDLDSRPCGFCAMYVFVHTDPQQPWKFATFLPIMGSASDHARDWEAHQEQFEGLIDIRPNWEPCPYYGCGVE